MSTRCWDTGIPSGKTVSVYITAVNSAGESQPTDAVQIVVL